MKPRELQRFDAKVERTSRCWLWTGALDRDGYPRLTIENRSHGAHRLAYKHWVDPTLPKGQHLDHLCRVRRCVNPRHLEPVTSRENTMRSPVALAAVNARKTHCIRGHGFTPANTYVTPAGKRQCRACRAGYKRRAAA